MGHLIIFFLMFKAQLPLCTLTSYEKRSPPRVSEIAGVEVLAFLM